MHYPLVLQNSISVAFSPNGAYLATANYGSNDVTVFSVTGGILSGGISSYRCLLDLQHPFSVAFSPNGCIPCYC